MIIIGIGNWSTIQVPKWQYNWVESFATLEGPVTFELNYTLLGFPGTNYEVDIINNVGYLPTNGN